MSRRRTSGRIGAVIALAALAAYYNTRRLSESGGVLKPTLRGESLLYNWRGFNIAYEKRGVGRSLVLLHGVYASASNAEMRRVFELFSTDFMTYAPDLIGFGRSSRPPIDYNDKLYTNFIRDFIRDVVGGGALVIANSLTSAYAIEVAAREPNLISKLVLVEPTGLLRLVRKSTPAQQLRHRALQVPLVGDNIFFGLTSKTAIRTFLENEVYYNKRLVTEGVVQQHYRTSHQPGAKWAPLAFITGRLNHNVRFSFPLLNMARLIIKGANSALASQRELDQFLQFNQGTDFHEFAECGALPHDEQAQAFHAYVRDWLLEEAEQEVG